MISSIGLTGGIGSGKSTVAALLVDCGALLVDTDAIARRLTEPGGAALPALVAAFGPEAMAANGSLDRERMRSIAFGDASAKARLQAVLHPLIGAEAEAQAALADGRPVVFDVPLLAESARWRARVERVLVVDCPESLQVQRVVRRSGWQPDAVQRVIDQQAPRASRRAMADAVVYNGEAMDLEALRTAVQALWRHWAGRRPVEQ